MTSLQRKTNAAIVFAGSDRARRISDLTYPVLIVLLLLLASVLTSQARAGAESGRPRQAAPELDGGIAWFNTSVPLHLADLRGKVVLLDFWTFCCINCIHTLPELARLEKKYPGELVIIGVHAPKFAEEKNSDKVKKAIDRYEVRHPVVNDANMTIWNAYQVQSWPTLVLIDPEGYVVSRGEGEGLGPSLDREIAKLVARHRKQKTLKTLDENPRSFAATGRPPAAPLLFPGKVSVDIAKNRLFIADSTHHRIVITDLQGQKVAIAGRGQPGKRDGAFSEASFNDPQGMASAGNTLYIADRKNHLIRQLDLATGTVKTIAGTGSQGHGRRGPGPAVEVALNSPWDLCLVHRALYIAMAGNHQIWKMDLDSNTVGPFAGSGREDIADGTLAKACFAQPSGLATDGKNLYVADSEASAIRCINLEGEPRVMTIVGKGLFDFGDTDGQGDQVRLQHPLGVAIWDGQLLVADTYNNKIKKLDPASGACKTFAGVENGKPVLNEPGGLCVAGNRIIVADTDASRVVSIDSQTGRVAGLDLNGVQPPEGTH
jgi:thiol-disulfide isomerase/thioredoxin/sugar lactone lactonase YvrE